MEAESGQAKLKGCGSLLLREFFGNLLCTFVLFPAIRDNGRPVRLLIKKSLWLHPCTHNAGVGGSSPPVATISRGYFAKKRFYLSDLARVREGCW